VASNDMLGQMGPPTNAIDGDDHKQAMLGATFAAPASQKQSGMPGTASLVGAMAKLRARHSLSRPGLLALVPLTLGAEYPIDGRLGGGTAEKCLIDLPS